MQSLPLKIEREQTEWKTIQAMAKNNFLEKFLANLKVQRQQKVNQKQDKNEKNWQSLESTVQKMRKVTNPFKHKNINIAFKSTNTTQQYTNPKTLDKNQDNYMNEIYKLTCNTRKMSYIGHTSRNLNPRYQGHIRYIRKMTPNLPTHSITTKLTRIRIYYRQSVPIQTHT
jgi:iron uptake system EfeUOB component EfeO/EfeM